MLFRTYILASFIFVFVQCLSQSFFLSATGVAEAVAGEDEAVVSDAKSWVDGYSFWSSVEEATVSRGASAAVVSTFLMICCFLCFGSIRATIRITVGIEKPA